MCHQSDDPSQHDVLRTANYAPGFVPTQKIDHPRRPSSGRVTVALLVFAIILLVAGLALFAFTLLLIRLMDD
jgi:hypothetical protein